MTRKKRMLILGCGYVGTALAKRFLTLGWQVEALSKNPETCHTLREMGCAQVAQARLDSKAWFDVFSSPDVLINCVSSAFRGLEGYRASYIEGQQSVLTWAQGRRIPLYIYTGATSVYPQSDGGWVDEASMPVSGLLSENGEVLRNAENLIFSASDCFERFAILRLAGIYGPDRHHFLDKLRAGYITFSGRGDLYLNLIHRDDIVEAVARVIEYDGPHESVFNLADGNPAPKQEVVDWIAECLGLEKPRYDVTQVSSRAPRRQVNGQLPNRRIDISRFKNRFSWEPLYPNFKTGYRQILGL